MARVGADDIRLRHFFLDESPDRRKPALTLAADQQRRYPVFLDPLADGKMGRGIAKGKRERRRCVQSRVAQERFLNRGRQALDYVYVGDVVDATLLAATHPAASGELLNVGSGRATSVAALTDRMIAVSGQPATPQPGPADETAGTCRVASIARIREKLGWEPRTDLGEGLARTWAGLERRR